MSPRRGETPAGPVPVPDGLTAGELCGLTLAELERRLAGVRLPAPHRATPADIECLERLGRILAADGRSGTERLAERFLRAARKCRAERRRVAAMLEAEAALCPPDAVNVAGIDEAGRGPLAGPVVAAAVILRPGVIVPGLNDSKQIPEDVREELYERILDASLAWGVGIAGPGLIDRINILQATYVAMRRAAAKLAVRPDYLLVDGFRVPGLDLPHRGVVHGDAICGSIAAASLIAKVTRDRIMRRVAERFPAFGFERNKGYSCREHWEALRRNGPCPAHRRSFLGGLQGSLFDEEEVEVADA